MDFFLNIPAWVWGLACLGVAALFTFLVPHKQLATATGWRRFLLRWGHALVWVFLAGLCFAQAFGLPGGNLLGIAAGLTYAAFLFAMFRR